MLYRFADCALDTNAVELRRDGATVALEPQVFAILTYLIEQRHRVVPKAELFDEIWAGRFVSDSALSSRIKSVRAAIGDDGTSQTLIRTVHKTGFRFVGAVEISRAEPETTAEVGPEISQAAAHAQSGAPEADWQASRRPDTGPVIAVLPFTTEGDCAGRHIFLDGLTQDIITALGRTRWLSVIARGSVFRFRNADQDPMQAGRILGARYVVCGTARFEGPKLQLQTSLVEVSSGLEIWVEHYDRPLESVFEIQSDIANSVGGAVASEVETAERQRALLVPLESLDAWEAYHRGCWHMYRFQPVNYDHAERFFRRSVNLEPAVPHAHAGLSFVHWQRAFLGLTADRDGAIAQARVHAQHCLELDPRDPKGHWALGRVFVLQGDFGQSIDELQCAVDLNPSSIMGLYSLGRSLMLTGELDASNAMVDTARRLSPFDPMVFGFASVKAQNLALLGRTEEAIHYADLAARQPNAHFHILAVAAVCHALAGGEYAARGYLDKLRCIKPRYDVGRFLRAFPLQREEHAAAVRDAFAQLEGV